jgi:hypothetical protein
VSIGVEEGVIVVVDEFCLCLYVCFFLLQQWWYVVT